MQADTEQISNINDNIDMMFNEDTILHTFPLVLRPRSPTGPAIRTLYQLYKNNRAKTMEQGQWNKDKGVKTMDRFAYGTKTMDKRQWNKEQRQWNKDKGIRNKEQRQKCIRLMWQTKLISLLSFVLAPLSKTAHLSLLSLLLAPLSKTKHISLSSLLLAPCSNSTQCGLTAQRSNF